MPDSIRSCGELMTPPASMTSRPARAVLVAPFCVVFDADGAVAFEKNFVASAPVSTLRFSRANAGRR